MNLVFNVISPIWSYIKPTHRFKLLRIVLVSTVSGIFELIILAFLYHLLSLLTGSSAATFPGRISSLPFLGRLTSFDWDIGYTSAIFIFCICVASLTRVYAIKSSGLLAAEITSDLSSKIFGNILTQPYTFHLSSNSSSSVSILASQIDRFLTSVNAMIQMASSIILALSIVCALLLIKPIVAIATLISIGSFYILIGRYYKDVLKRNSSIIVDFNTKRLQILQESLNGIRDVLLSNAQEKHLEDYKNYEFKQRRLGSLNIYYSLFPRYAVEAFTLIVMIIIMSILASNGIKNALPIIGAIVLGCQRLIPTFQQFYYTVSIVRGFSGDLRSIRDSLDLSKSRITLPEEYPLSTITKTFPVNFYFLEFKHVTFGYEKNSEPILKDLSIKIPLDSSAILLGPSGSGKSTFMDLILGLLKPLSGQILLDKYDLHSTPGMLSHWQNMLSYVPQNIHLNDASIADNVAYGNYKNKIDSSLVQDSCQKAYCNSFIQSLPLGYETMVGENGTSLSGGQKQRIGIARSFYRRKAIIFLDEATSALDQHSESVVLESIFSNDYKMIFMITHKSSLVHLFKYCIDFNGSPILVDLNKSRTK